MALIELLGSPVVLALLGYAGLVVVLALAMQPMRLRIVALGEELLAQPHWNRAQRDEINNLLDTMDCLISSIVFPMAVIGATYVVVFDRPVSPDKNLEALARNETFDELTSLWFLSLLGANPLVAMLTLPLLAICVPIMLVARRGTFMDKVERPVLHASAAITSAYHARRVAA